MNNNKTIIKYKEKLNYFYKMVSLSSFEFRLIVSFFSILIFSILLPYSFFYFGDKLFLQYSYYSCLLINVYYISWLLLTIINWWSSKNLKREKFTLKVEKILFKMNSFEIWGSLVFNLWFMSLFNIIAFWFVIYDQINLAGVNSQLLFWIFTSLFITIVFTILVWIDFKSRDYEVDLNRFSFLKITFLPTIYFIVIITIGSITSYFPYDFFNFKLQNFSSWMFLILYYPAVLWGSLIFQNIFINTQILHINAKKKSV